MKLRQLKFFLDSLSQEELDKEVLVYDPYFLRVVQVRGFDHLSVVQSMKQPKGDEPLVLVVAGERK